MPESSASAGAPVAALAARAFSRAFSANVSPVSGGSSTSSGRGASSTSGSSRRNSRSLWALRVASTTGTAAVLPDRFGLDGAQGLDPVGREREQLVEVRARERCALRRGLDLYQAAVARHDDVGVDLG